MTGSPIRRAESHEAIKPLIELCKAGKLFEVQGRIEAGEPVNPPPHPGKGARKKTPLEYAIDLGFHSLVEVLLKGGAEIDLPGFCPVQRAIEKKRLDMVLLLVEHGYDPSTVDMRDVFSSWEPEMMEYFIDRGADVETGMPLAQALCDRIRTTLRIFKKYKDKYPSFQEQANVALRHHCREGNMKWISLLLWAGADPLAPGEPVPGDEPDPEDGGLSALGFAALYDHFEVFDMRGVKLDPEHPAMREILRYSCTSRGIEVVERLLAMGVDPNDQANGGSSMIQGLVQRLEWGRRFKSAGLLGEDFFIDSEESLDAIKCIHLLAKHGGRWVPTTTSHINAARRSLLKVAADYTVEFVWIMKKYDACSKADVEDLLRTDTIKRHTAKFRNRLAELLEKW